MDSEGGAEMKLDSRTTELIAIGASVTANCQPCLEYHVGKAQEQGIERQDIDDAITIGKMVRRGAAAGLDTLALTLGSQDPQRAASPGGGCGCR
jgi:AhpD family alkylhydroperoxidase